MDERRELGFHGETLAAKFLERQGFRILDSNYRCKLGELDLVALEETPSGTSCLAFVEVKTRRGSAWGSPEEAVDSRKRRKLLQLARHYLQSHPNLSPLPCRFDVIAVTLDPLGRAEIEHYPDAFDGV